jgi:uncharacterized protein (DUF433 family)
MPDVAAFLDQAAEGALAARGAGSEEHGGHGGSHFWLPVMGCVDRSLRPAYTREVQARLVTSDPRVMMGKPVIVGTRITVELILEKLAQGETPQQILDSHPRLTEGAIRAALAFAAEALRADVVYPLDHGPGDVPGG